MLNLKTCEIPRLLSQLVEISNRVRAGYDLELPVVTIIYQHGQRFTGSVVNRMGSNLVLTSASDENETSQQKEKTTQLMFLEANFISAITLDWNQHDIDSILNGKQRDSVSKLTRDDLDKLAIDLESELATCQCAMKITLDKSLLKDQKKANFAGIIAKDTVKVLMDMAKDEITREAICDSIKTIILKIDQESSLDLMENTLTISSTYIDDCFQRKTMKQMRSYLESAL